MNVVDFIENFYGCSVETLRDQLNAMDGDLGQAASLLRLSDFTHLFHQQFVLQFDSSSLPQGQALPAFVRAGASYNRTAPRSHWASTSPPRSRVSSSFDTRGLIRDCFGPPTLLDSRELKSILLYSQRSILIDPFSPRRQLTALEFEMLRERFGPRVLNPNGDADLEADLRRTATSYAHERTQDAANTLKLVGDIAPLLRSGDVIVAPLESRKSLFWGDEDLILADIAYELKVRIEPARSFDQLRLLAFLLLERAKDQVLALIHLGPECTAFAAGSLDLIALDRLLSVQDDLDSRVLSADDVDSMTRGGPDQFSLRLPDSRDRDLASRTSEDQRLTEIARLELPGVDTLRARDMVEVRKLDLFERLRSDVRRALALSADEPDLATARSLFNEEIRAARDQLARGCPGSRRS
jgi:hypothetical protein